MGTLPGRGDVYPTTRPRNRDRAAAGLELRFPDRRQRPLCRQMNISEIVVELQSLADCYTCAAENHSMHSGRYEKCNWQRKARLIETAIRKLEVAMPATLQPVTR